MNTLPTRPFLRPELPDQTHRLPRVTVDHDALHSRIASAEEPVADRMRIGRASRSSRLRRLGEKLPRKLVPREARGRSRARGKHRRRPCVQQIVRRSGRGLRDLEIGLASQNIAVPSRVVASPTRRGGSALSRRSSFALDRLTSDSNDSTGMIRSSAPAGKHREVLLAGTCTRMISRSDAAVASPRRPQQKRKENRLHGSVSPAVQEHARSLGLPHVVWIHGSPHVTPAEPSSFVVRVPLPDRRACPPARGRRSTERVPGSPSDRPTRPLPYP